MKELKVYTIIPLQLDKHRLEKKMAYSEREKYYKPKISFQEVLRMLDKS